jgi:hypothetical protein
MKTFSVLFDDFLKRSLLKADFRISFSAFKIVVGVDLPILQKTGGGKAQGLGRCGPSKVELCFTLKFMSMSSVRFSLYLFLRWLVMQKLQHDTSLTSLRQSGYNFSTNGWG